MTYAAQAEAELQAAENPADWVDPRIQIVTTGNRAFKCDNLCTETLFAEVKELIDALRR